MRDEPRARSPRPAVETIGGPVSGFASGDVSVFRGIRYAAPPLRSLRFRPPQPVLSRDGGRPQQDCAAVAVQYVFPDPASVPPESRWFDAWAPRSEDCLVLNVWAPSTPGPLRPVMVWIHGGAFGGGSGYSPLTDGTHLADREDVVVVSLNHRLGGFGFLSLAAYGLEYADSGNVGLLDIVAALGWVRDNIERFGGDPRNVTLFGQSGGGWKISALLAMRSARGLFGKAIIQSGSYLRALDQEHADRIGRDVLKRLGIAGSQLHRISDVPVEVLETAMDLGLPPDHPARDLSPEEPAQIFEDGTWTWNFNFGPVIDGRSLTRHPYHPDAPPEAVGVSLMIGTTKDELDPEGAAAPFPASLSLLEKITRLGLPNDISRAVIATYRNNHPGATDDEVLGALQNDALFSVPALRQTERSLDHGGNSVYSYLFAWESPAQRNRAAHTAEIPFVFGTLNSEVVGAPLDAETQSLGEHMRRAWAAFARSGNPNTPGLPDWRPYSLERRDTMIFDRRSHVDCDPRLARARVLGVA